MGKYEKRQSFTRQIIGKAQDQDDEYFAYDREEIIIDIESRENLKEKVKHRDRTGDLFE